MPLGAVTANTVSRPIDCSLMMSSLVTYMRDLLALCSVMEHRQSCRLLMCLSSVCESSCNKVRGISTMLNVGVRHHQIPADKGYESCCVSDPLQSCCTTIGGLHCLECRQLASQQTEQALSENFLVDCDTADMLAREMGFTSSHYSARDGGCGLTFNAATSSWRALYSAWSSSLPAGALPFHWMLFLDFFSISPMPSNTFVMS